MERDNKGRFIKGNKVARKKAKPEELKNIKSETLNEVYKCALSLTEPWSTLKDDLGRPEASRLEYLTAKAVASKNYKFISWLIEMVAGKPNNSIEVDDSKGKEIVLKYSLGEKDGKKD